MGVMLAIAGDPQAYNAVAQAITKTFSPTVNANYDGDYIGDGDPGTVTMFGSYATPSYARFDLSRISNPSFDTDLTGWDDLDAGTGASTRTAVGAEVHSGAGALKLVAGASSSNDARRGADTIEIPAGKACILDFWARGTGAGAQGAAVRIQNPKTGHWLHPDGTWGTAVDAAVGTTGTSYARVQLAFRVESLEEMGGADSVALRIEVYTTGGVTAYVDDLTIYPAVDFAGIFGADVDPGWTVTLQSSDDNFGASTTEGTFSLGQRRSAYLSLSSAVYRRYWAVNCAWSGTLPSGESPAIPALGEVVIGESLDLDVAYHPSVGAHQRTVSRPQIRNTTMIGRTYTTNLGDSPVTSMSLPVRLIDLAELDAFEEQVWNRSAGGAYPTVLVPTTDRVEVYFAILGDSMRLTNNDGDNERPFHEATLTFADMPPMQLGA